MKIIDLLKALTEKFTPMDDNDREKLHNNAVTVYAKEIIAIEDIEKHNILAAEFNVNKTKEIEKGTVESMQIKKLSIVQKILKILEHPFARYAIAISFIFLVPYIKDLMAGRKKEEDNGADDLQAFMEFRRMSRN